MQILPSGSTAVLVELSDLAEVGAWYEPLRNEPPAGVLDIVPAARTILLVFDPDLTSGPDVERAVRAIVPRAPDAAGGELLDVPVHYDGEDLAEAADLLGWSADELVDRHTGQEWTVAFCGFAPGFGYLTGGESWDVPRRSTPRTKVPAGSVALAGEFTGVYPRVSPGGWQLIGRTELTVFDVDRDPPALLRPGIRVRFVRA